MPSDASARMMRVILPHICLLKPNRAALEKQTAAYSALYVTTCRAGGVKLGSVGVILATGAKGVTRGNDVGITRVMQVSLAGVFVGASDESKSGKVESDDSAHVRRSS
jgi:hypothetical protein